MIESLFWRNRNRLTIAVTPPPDSTATRIGITTFGEDTCGLDGVALARMPCSMPVSLATTKRAIAAPILPIASGILVNLLSYLSGVGDVLITSPGNPDCRNIN